MFEKLRAEVQEAKKEMLAQDHRNGKCSCMQNFGYLSIGRDHSARAFVINYTANWFSVGFTTSPSTNVSFVGFTVVGRGRNSVREFRGIVPQLGFWWFKLYLYIYFDGDGRAKVERTSWPDDEYSLAMASS